jgi:hypothetical protein
MRVKGGTGHLRIKTGAFSGSLLRRGILRHRQRKNPPYRPGASLWPMAVRGVKNRLSGGFWRFHAKRGKLPGDEIA